MEASLEAVLFKALPVKLQHEANDDMSASDESNEHDSNGQLTYEEEE